MITIERRIDWHKVYAEYLAGGISQRKLAQKYKIPWSTLEKRAHREKWADDRERARTTIAANAVQETAEAVSENAAIAARIKTKLLKRLEKEINALPEMIGSETSDTGIEWGKNDKGNKIRKERTRAYKLRDLTAAYKDLTDDMPKEESTETLEKLDKLLEVAWNAAHE